MKRVRSYRGTECTLFEFHTGPLPRYLPYLRVERGSQYIGCLTNQMTLRALANAILAALDKVRGK